MLNSADLLRRAPASARYKSPGDLFQSICNCIASVLLKLYYYLVVMKQRFNLLTSYKVFIFLYKITCCILIRVSINIGTYGLLCLLVKEGLHPSHHLL